MVARIQDIGEGLHSFAHSFLVKCPKCSACSISHYLDYPNQEKRFCCTKCGTAKDGQAMHDLWLQKSCCGQNLWAYNLDHLAAIEAFVQAKHRERHHLRGYRNSSLFSRLPKWIQSAKNRDAVLRSILKLRNSVPSEIQKIQLVDQHALSTRNS